MSRTAALEARIQPLARWLSRYVNGHRLLWLLVLVCFLIAWNRGIALLYGLVALLLALLTISWIAPWLNLRQLHIRRQQLGQAQVGQSIQLQYTFVTPQPGYFVTLSEHIGDHSGSHFLARIEPQHSCCLSYPASQRGIFQLAPSRIASGWPFGLLERPISARCEPCQLEIQPARFDIHTLPQPGSQNPLPEGSDSCLQRQAQSEYSGVRPLRPGDSLKHVHWSASARQQQLVVREYHSYDTPCWLVVIDAQRNSAIGQGSDNSFEYALSIAASLVQFAQQQQLRLQLVVGCQQPLQLTVEPGKQDLQPVFSALAAVQDDGELEYSQLLQQTLNRSSDNPVLITVRHSGQTLDCQPPAGHIDIVFNQQSFITPMASYAEGWRSLNPHCLQLQLHRLSNIAQVWNA